MQFFINNLVTLSLCVIFKNLINVEKVDVILLYDLESNFDFMTRNKARNYIILLCN